MFARAARWPALVVVLAGFTPGAGSASPPVHRAPAQALIADDFERGLDRWSVIGEGTARLTPSGDPRHGTVLELVPNGDAAVLIRGSETWGRVRMEGEMLFPTDEDSYLGFLYGFTTRRERRDFGLIYVKGNDSYLQVNPHRDFNVSRLLYPELHVDLTGPSAVTVGTWQRFALEVDGATAHLYVGDTSVPQVTFSELELDSGAIGLQPRSVGGSVWVDNVTVRPIDRLSHDGPAIPARVPVHPSTIVRWQVAGPFARTRDTLALAPVSSPDEWRPFATDARGAVVTGRVVDTHGPDSVAYFRTRVDAARAERVNLQLGTIDDMAIWLNGAFQGFLSRQGAAWFDAGLHPSHPARRVPLSLQPGPNDIVIRVRGGVYASGGFFARLEPPASRQSQPSIADFEPLGVRIESARHQGREALRLIESDANREGGLALLKGVAFRDGTIEVDVAGRRGPHAVPDDRGFIGIAFRVREGGGRYEYIYLRPDNGRADDQVRRNHSTQYAAHPDFGFGRLRRESPERYESYVDLEPGAWTRMRIVVAGVSARLYVGDAPQPVLVVNDLKLGSDGGGVALWIGAGTEGFFSNLRVR